MVTQTAGMICRTTKALYNIGRDGDIHPYQRTFREIEGRCDGKEKIYCYIGLPIRTLENPILLDYRLGLTQRRETRITKE